MDRRRLGRPKIKDPRTHQYRIRLNDVEWEVLQELIKQGVNISESFRFFCNKELNKRSDILRHIVITANGTVDGVPVRVDVGAIVTPEELEGMYKMAILLENEHLSSITSIKINDLDQYRKD